VTGDVKTEEVLHLAKQYYGKLPAQNKQLRFVVKEPPQMALRRKNLKLNIQVEKILIAYRIPNAKSSDTPALNVLQNILAGSKSSRFEKALVDAGIATSVDANSNEDKDPSLFVIGVNLQQGKTAARAESIVLKIFKDLESKKIKLDELTRAKNKINFGFFESLGSNYERAAFLGQNEAVYGDFQAGILSHEKIQKITENEVRSVVKKYFNPRNRTVIIGIQKGSKK
jgi:predicted Zn-dependent peptidase